MTTTFGNAIEYMKELGIFDVVLPFIITFAIVYSILDKTRVLGVEEFDGKKYPRRGINSVVAFAVALLVVGAFWVKIMNNIISQITLLIIIAVFYMILIGVANKNGEETELTGGWKTFFMVLMFIGVAFIFANNVPVSKGTTALEWFYQNVIQNVSSAGVSATILILVLVGIMYAITRPESGGGKE